MKMKYGYGFLKPKTYSTSRYIGVPRKWYERVDWGITSLVAFLLLLLSFAIYDAVAYKCVEYGEWKTIMVWQSTGSGGYMRPQLHRECLHKVKRSDLKE